MAFKRSGVRLPLAPPLSELHFNGLCANKFRGSFKEKVIKSYKGLLPNCGCVADRKSSRRAGNLPLRRGTFTRWMSLAPRRYLNRVDFLVIRSFDITHNAILAD